MTRERVFRTAVGLVAGMTLGLVLACSFGAEAQENGYWRAANSTAQSITGDVTLSDAKITIGFSGFPTARIRDLKPNEVSAAFDVDNSSAGNGSLYRVSIPASRKFMHRNSLCGSDDAQWMAVYAAGHFLHLAFFSGQKMPVFAPDAIADSTDLCGTFSYER
ncbi:MAG TPA: hypothetical protein VGR96_06135 [Acidobacteriaceae bacterium]|nr:hypothetical protein [Acidobacteriaceae bacterium]